MSNNSKTSVGKALGKMVGSIAAGWLILVTLAIVLTIPTLAAWRFIQWMWGLF
jgi:hypothetical protein